MVDRDRFRAAVLSHVRPYVDVLCDVAEPLEIDPFIFYGIGQQETLWGTAKALDVVGPHGTGDHTPRIYGPATQARLGGMIVAIEKLPAGLIRCTPSDGRGWGRGLMQIDWAAQSDWFATKPDWGDPAVNLTKAASVFTTWRRFIAARSALQGDALTRAAVASYNTGGGNVLKSIREGKPVDTTTAHGNYSARVLAFAAAVRGAYGAP